MNAYLLQYASGIASNGLRLALWLIVLVAIFVPLEHLCALHPAKVWRKQVAVDLGWYFINSLLPAAVLATPLALLAAGLHAWNPGGVYGRAAVLPFWGKMILVVLVNDIGAYWGHRAMHAHRWLWRFHAVHHSAEEMDWLVNTRAHPFDTIFVRFAGLAPVYLLGLAQPGNGKIDPAVALLLILGTLWTFFIHANLRIRLGWCEWLVSSPAFHHWHHTKDEQRDHNFAFIFPVIDWLFGTAWLPKAWPKAYGITGEMPSTLAGQFFHPIEATGSSAPAPRRTDAAEAAGENRAGDPVEGQVREPA